ncbi:ABC transporter [Actinobacteria bacterium YIM 96077]|uniref:Transport permease protein n=2 Tax=Phytoactinopolyspora halophila TaxID=1981511 RepID=A0A329QX12_9ACTN|nr:ABC transporter [Actinobacteria bacterium YIM 96077]RAW16516.1 ABC transporter [Phytoactinopolyspora halophila]
MWNRALAHWLAHYRRVWRGTIISGILQPLFFLLAMGMGLGTLVDAGTSGGIEGVDYLLFLAPGILAAQAMQTAVFESTFPVLGAIKWQRQYHAMLAAPLGIPDIVLGHLVFVMMRVAMTSTIFVTIATLFGAITSWWVLLALPVAVLTGLAFAAPVVAFAARQRNESGFNMLFRFIVLPMFLFSGTFFPVEQLPTALELIARITPLWHAVELCRGLALETMTLAGAAAHVAYLVVLAGIGIQLALMSVRKRLIL